MGLVSFLTLNQPTYLLRIKELKKQQKLTQIFSEEERIFLLTKVQVFLTIQALSKILLLHYFLKLKVQVTMTMDLEIALNLNKPNILKLIHKRAKQIIHMMTVVQFYWHWKLENSRRVEDNWLKISKSYYRSKNHLA